MTAQATTHRTYRVTKGSHSMVSLGHLRLSLLGWLVCGALGVMLATPMAASASFGVTPGSFFADTFSPVFNGPDMRAGARPAEAQTSFTMNVKPGTLDLEGGLKDTRVDLPPGFVGNPQAIPACPRARFAAIIGSGTEAGTRGCPLASQVGVVTVKLIYPGFVADIGPLPIYNVEPLPGDAADFGFVVTAAPVHIVASLRPEANYGVRATVRNVSQTLPVFGTAVTLWGVPSDPSHDALRACDGGQDVVSGGCSVSGARAAFLTNGTECSGPVTTTLAVAEWKAPTTFLSNSYTTAAGVDDCDRTGFAPHSEIGTSTASGDAPTGLTVGLTFDQNDDADGRGMSPLRTAKVTLPDGLTVNPASAGGLDACTDAQLALKTNDPVGCPEASKLGTVTAETPLLDEPLTGSVYLRTQNSGDPESGEMFRLALVVENRERGLLVKLPGSVKVNKDTGQITTEVVDNPQVPVSKVTLNLKAGPRAPLATPVTCGSRTATASLSSWSGKQVALNSPIDTACTGNLGAFAPSLTAGAQDATAGAFSPFALTIAKPDGNSAVNGVSLTMPTGLLAKLKGNLGTQVGTVKAFAGPGATPYALPGQVFLEGPYGDAPFSLRVVVPAKAGPFDLGVVEVKQKIYVDPITAQVTVVSDPIPTIVKGVPVRLQRLDVNVDKPGFMINPTSCAAKTIGGTVKSVAGQTAALSVRFQASACSSLDLKPELGLALSGKGQTTDGKHPAISASLVQKSGQSNLKKVRVALPLSLALDVDNANGLCEFVDGSKVTPTCPKASIVGSVTATTPILDEPLSGPVYFVKNVRKDPKSGRDIRTLPKLVIPLVGQNGVKLTLTGTSDVEDDQLVTTFDSIPDAPVSSFKLNINGGKGGILAVSDADICKATQIAEQQVDGQNGKQADTDVFIQTPSCPTRILSKKVGKTTVALKIGGLGAGKVTVTGRGIRKTTKSIAKSTVATITAKRTGKAKPGAFKVKFTKAKAAPAR